MNFNQALEIAASRNQGQQTRSKGTPAKEFPSVKSAFGYLVFKNGKEVHLEGSPKFLKTALGYWGTINPVIALSEYGPRDKESNVLILFKDGTSKELLSISKVNSFFKTFNTSYKVG